MAVFNENGNPIMTDGMFGGEGAWWLLILFFFFSMMGGNCFGNFGNNNCNLGAEMQRSFDQQSVINGINSINQNLNNAELTRNCMSNNITNSINALAAQQQAQTQLILDKMCQDKIESKNDIIADLRSQINMANMRASMTAQTATVLADNAAQTMAVEHYLKPAAVPAYIVQNPNTAYPTSYSSGCCQ